MDPNENLNNADTLETIFSKALKSRSLFKDHKALQPDFVPEHLPFRNTQLSSMAQVLAPILHGSKPSNLLIYGKTGTGKTAAIRHITTKLAQTAQKKQIDSTFIYCNARMSGTEYRTLSELAAGIGLKIPFTGLAISEVLSRTQHFMKQHSSKTIFIIDEIDYLVKAYGDDLLYDLTNSPDRISPAFLSLIGISNDLRFKEELGARVQSRLSEEELLFPPYTAEELKTILSERAVLALHSNSYTQSAINLCAALSGSEHGDARRAVDLLRIAGEVAERESSDQLEEKHVRIALQKIDQDRVSDALKTLPLHAKIILLASIYSSQNDNSHSSSGFVYDKYSELCKRTGLEPLTTRRVSGLLTELDTLGIVTAPVINYGRYGRTKKIIPQVSLSIASKAFQSDDTIKHLIP